jgi:hypothetical protein
MKSSTRNRTLFTLGIIIAFVFLTACNCFMGVMAGCMMQPDPLNTVKAECWHSYADQCSLETMNIDEYNQCTEAYINDNGLLEDLSAPAPVVPQGGTNNLVAPTGLNCNLLRLTSPLGGLPNGVATFYWDVLPGAVAYRINIYDNVGTFLSSFDSQGAATSLSADVSWAAIGGQYDLQVELVAFGGGTSCRETVTISREAPSGGMPSNGGGNGGNGGNGGVPAPTATPTCQEDPSQNWCIR